MLNPFVVSTEGDVGYLAQNSIAGSRLNSKLSDLAVPTSAFTKEFMQDTAVTSIDELAIFMPSTQIVYPENINLFIADDSRSVRTRGLPASVNTVNFFQSPLRLDTYNIERAEESRGPNSILFGLGSPGGVVNVATNRAVLNHHFSSATFQARSYEGRRAVIDVNMPVLKNRLALRLDAVKDNRNGWRDNEYDNQDRVYLTAKWQVTSKTTVNAEWEHGIVNKSIIQPSTVQDAYTIWANAGRRLSATANAAAGIKVISTAPYLSVNTATGAVLNQTGSTVSVANTIDAVQVYLSDFSIVPKQAAIYAGPAFPQQTNYGRGSVFINHAFTPELSVELAANKRYNNHFTYVGRQYTLLQVDTNVTLPNGQPNPNAGRPFIEGWPGTTYSNGAGESLRLSAAFARDFGRFGKHQIAVLGEREITSGGSGQHLVFIDRNPYSLAAPDNANNRVRWRTYLDLTGPSEYLDAGDWRTTDLNHLVDQTGTVRGANWIIGAAGSGAVRQARNSAVAVLQSHFFRDRLITVVGYRADTLDSWESTTTRGPAYGGFATGALIVLPPGGTPTVTTAYNQTESVVLRVTKWLGVTYNRAENSALGAGNYIATDVPPNSAHPGNPRGKSQDYGLKIDLGHRASLNVLYYQTAATKGVQGLSGGPESGFNTIWTALGAANIKSPDGRTGAQMQSFANEYTFDSAGKGYEMELIANPTNNWRIYANFSAGLVSQTNIGTEGRAYLAKYHDFWLQGTNGRVLLDGSGRLASVANDGTVVIDTVAKEVAAIDQQMYNLYILPDGQRARSDIKNKVYLRTNYSFNEGARFLRGTSVGAGVRYQSGEVTNYDIPTKRTVFGRPNTLVDVNLGYKGRGMWAERDVRWSVQLNVNNAMNQTKILPMRVSSTGAILNYRLQTPREFILTTKFDF